MVPIDPLADTSNRLLDEVSCTSPLPTRRMKAETIESHFSPQSFDMIYCTRLAVDSSMFRCLIQGSLTASE